MCGISGVLDLGTGQAPSEGELRAMIARLHHRGPDGVGTYRKGPAGLAHARLSIIDIAGGTQPIHNEDRSAWVIFNGEIFNYIELRRDLERLGHCFYTHSDTEVIVHLYEQYGDRFVEHLNGQFAIALWDERRERLVLARDRAGIRPLFYARAGGRLLFASEVKALFALPDLPRRFDVEALGDIFTYWSPLEPRSAFAGVSSLPPGHVMVVAGGQLHIERYWDWQFPAAEAPDTRSEQDCADQLRDLLVDAVRLQLRADVPVGAYLSGGLDSSIVTTLIRNFTDTPLRTFSLTFADPEFDESAYQRELVDYLGTDHSSIRCTRAEIAAAFPRAVWHAESPIVRTAPAPMMLLSQSVRAAGYKVVLTGEGADEVFGGYDLFKEAKIRRFLAREPASKWRPLILERLYPYLKHSPAAGKAFTQRFFSEGLEHIDEAYFSHIPRWTTTRRIWQFLSGDVRQRLGERDPYRAVAGMLPGPISSWAPLSRDQYVEAHTLLSGYLLSSQGDRVGMANSIENRFPFLDHRLIEFANGLPPKFKLKGLTEKYLLKKATAPYLPASINRRTKQPYRAPDSASFFEEGRPVEYVAELLSPARIADAGLFDAQAVGKLVEKCRTGRAIGFADNMAFVGVLSTMLLHEQYVARDGAPSQEVASHAPAACV